MRGYQILTFGIALVVSLATLSGCGADQPAETPSVGFTGGSANQDAVEQGYQKGATDAQYAVGYELGAQDALAEIARADEEKLNTLIRMASEENDVRSQLFLGFMFINGNGVPQDYAEAMKWFRLAADQGNADGQVRVGYLYQEGLGVVQDFEEAVRWFYMAANQGNSFGQFCLGMCFGMGQGTPVDSLSAYVWFSLATSKDAEYADMRDVAAKELTPDQLAWGQQLARDWRPTGGQVVHLEGQAP